MTAEKSKKQFKKKGVDPIVRMFFWLIILVVVGFVLDIKGPEPCKGWIKRTIAIVKGQPVPKDQDDSSPGPDELASGPDTAPVEGDGTEPAAADTAASAEGLSIDDIADDDSLDTEDEMKTLFNTFLAQTQKPAAGKQYKVHLKDGSVEEGALQKIRKDKAYFKLQYGKTVFRRGDMKEKTDKQLFPKYWSYQKATVSYKDQIRQRINEAEQRELAAAKAAEDAAAATPDAGTVKMRPKGTAASAYGLKYDPSPGPTPEQLLPTLKSYGLWLKFQQRRMGGKFIDKIYAKYHGGNAVIYMVMDDVFVEAEKEERVGLTEVLWHTWANRCRTNKCVTRMARAHLVVVDKNLNIVGGSTTTRSSQIWGK